jgi:hypothetical protein
LVVRVKRAIVIVAAIALLVGCEPDGPATTRASSAAFATLAERTAFLNRYVSFRRTYETLDFDVFFRNNSGGLVPGPSDWDIRIVATVPAAELPAWIPAGVTPAPVADSDWLKSVPTTRDRSGIREWYVEGRRIVGIDRERRIVAYRAASRRIS